MSRVGTSHPTPEKLWESRAEGDSPDRNLPGNISWCRPGEEDVGRAHLGILGVTDLSLGMRSRMVPLTPVLFRNSE